MSSTHFIHPQYIDVSIFYVFLSISVHTLELQHKLFFYFFLWCNSPTGAYPTSLLRFLDHTHTWQDFPERVISSSERPLTTQHTNTRDEHPFPHRIFVFSCVQFVLYPYFFIYLDCPAFCLLFFTYNKTTQTSMPQAGFEPATPANERPQILALDGSATGTGQ